MAKTNKMEPIQELNSKYKNTHTHPQGKQREHKEREGDGGLELLFGLAGRCNYVQNTHKKCCILWRVPKAEYVSVLVLVLVCVFVFALNAVVCKLFEGEIELPIAVLL